MTLTAYGFDGTVIEAGWAKLSRYLGYGAAIGAVGDFAPTAVSGVDRTVRVAAGGIYKSGVLVISDANADVQADVLASGTRWDTLVLRRDWQTNTVSLVMVAGTATKQIAGGLNAAPGTIEDQVIALVQITAGQQSPSAVVDMRPLSVDADRAAVGTEKFWPVDGPLPEGYVEEVGTLLDRVKHSKLFALLGTTYGPGDGSTTFAVPNVAGRVLVAKDAGQTEFDTIGEVGGAKTHTLAVGELPGHAHGLGGHAHVASSSLIDITHGHDMSHGHGRAYGQTYGGAGSHQHQTYLGDVPKTGSGTYAKGYNATPGDATTGAGAHDHSAYVDVPAFSGTTGNGGGAHAHSVTVNAATGNTDSAGGGGAHNNLQPYAVRRVIIKAL